MGDVAGDPSVTASGGPADDAGPRKYDNSRRRAQAEATRSRIVEAGAELLGESTIRDWQHVTVRAVAERAGVHERTVYRHFGTDKRLRDAVMAHQEVRAGVDLSTVELADLADVAGRVLRFAASYSRSPEPPIDPTLHDADNRRRATLLRAVSEGTETWSEADRVRAAAVIDLIWRLSSFDRLRTAWGLDGDDAIRVIEWGVQVIVDATSDDPDHHLPPQAGAARPGRLR